ncbi:MAG: type II secretion system F family protein, partial [Clostridiales bacterium]|nr:type II secretion system F family protein [Clostridiales bacterium]
MPQYAYEAIGKSKKVYRGVAEADRPEDVVTILRETGLYAYSVRVKKPVYLFPLQTSRKVRISDLSRLTRQFATLISSGVTVPQSLAILANQSTNAVLAKALKKITADVTAGASLADAFGKFPEIFDDLFVSMLRAGELGGNLTDILSRLSVHLEKEMKLRSNIKSAVNYPRFVGSFALVMFIVMMVFLVPSFKDFTSSATEIPAVTQFIYDLSDSMRGFWYVWLLVLSAMALAVVMFFRSRIGHELWERRKLRMPLVGSLISKTVISRFVRTLATLLRGGIPIVRAL